MTFSKQSTSVSTRLALLILLISGSSLSLQQPRIAIIGAGVGGAFTAAFSRKLLGPLAVIDVFERGEVGGRTQVLSLDGKVIELGASIIHKENRYFRQAAEDLKLDIKTPPSDQPSIYNGQQFVITFSYWTILNFLYLLVRYGWQYFMFAGAPASLLQRYKQIYELQGNGTAFTTPEGLLRAVGLYDLTQHSFHADVQARLGSSAQAIRFLDEFLGAVNRVQYNQNSSMSALAGMVGTLPVTDGRLFRVAGGNVRVPVDLLDQAMVRGHWPLNVTQVECHSNGSFTLHTDAGSAGGSIPLPKAWGPFDAVVIATPLEGADLKFRGVDLPDLPPRKYQRTVSTILRGRLDPTYFGLNALPGGEYIMVTEAAATPFSVIAPIGGVDDDGLRLYKTFSELPLSAAELASIFRNATVITQRDWRAYPHFSPPEQFAPFQLAEGLFYSNAWENSASAMEMSAVAAKNNALLLQRFLANKSSPRTPGQLASRAVTSSD